MVISTISFQAMKSEDVQLKGSWFNKIINKSSKKFILAGLYVEGSKPFTYKTYKNQSTQLGIDLLIQEKCFETIPSENVLKIDTGDHHYIITNGDYQNRGDGLWCFEITKEKEQRMTFLNNHFLNTRSKENASKSLESLVLPRETNLTNLLLTKSDNNLCVNEDFNIISEKKYSIFNQPHYSICNIDIEVYDNGLSFIFSEK